MKKLIDKDPFSDGNDHRVFEEYCCSKCIKSSEPREGRDGLVKYINEREDGLPKCSIQRDIVLRMFSNKPISQRTIDICRDFIMYGVLCPYMKTKRKKYKKKDPINQQKLDL